MTISATEFREDYQGNGSVAAYDYSWRIYDESELAVYQLDNDGNETKLVLNQDYTVSGVRLVSGGQVTLSSNLPNGYRLTIIPDVPVEQQTDFRNQGRFFPETHEEQFDKLAVISKQQAEVLSRAIKMSAVVSPADFNPEVPAGIVGEANVLLMTSADGKRFIKGPTRPELEGLVQTATEQANRAESEADRAEGAAEKAADNAVDEAEVRLSGYLSDTENARDASFNNAQAAGQSEVDAENSAIDANNAATQLNAVLDDAVASGMSFPLDLGSITESPVANKYDLGSIV